MGILCTSTGMNRIDDGRIVEAGSDCHGRIQPVRDSSQGGPDQPGRSVPNDLAGRLGIARSLRPYTRSESNVARDLEEVSRFFGIKKTSKVMATLTGATSSSLSRAGGRGPASGAEPAGRVAGRIAVLAALAIEMRKYLVEVSGEPPRAADMYRWLLSGRMETASGPRRPLEVLSDPEALAQALAEIRAARRQLQQPPRRGPASGTKPPSLGA